MQLKKLIKTHLTILAGSLLLTGCPEDIPNNHPCHYFDKTNQQCLPSELVDKKNLVYVVGSATVSMDTVLGGQCFPPGEAEALLEYARKAQQQLHDCKNALEYMQMREP